LDYSTTDIVLKLKRKKKSSKTIKLKQNIPMKFKGAFSKKGKIIKIEQNKNLK
jgi:hypothetical protein